MINYIFKNKTKNILAIIFTLLSVLNSNIIYNIYNYVTHREFPVRAVLALLPYILILTYLFTLRREYKLKEWLFPAAFLIFAGLNAYSMVISLITNASDLNSLKMVMWCIWIIVCSLIIIAAHILCFLGTIKNFKNVKFLRVGMIVLITLNILSQIIEFIFVGGFNYFSNIEQEYLMIICFSMVKAIIKIIVNLLFYFGILNLTFNKCEETEEK